MGAIELGAIYQVYNPDQTEYFCLNNPADPNFVGYVTDVTGLDSAGVRENAQPKAAAPGGYNGPFWADRRPWTISGFVQPIMPIAARSAAQDLIQGIMMQCLQEDGILTWLPSDGIQKAIAFRNQQPYRSTTGQSNVNRNYLISGVAADWRIFSNGTTTLTVAGSSGIPLTFSTSNVGNADSPFAAELLGPAHGFTISNLTTGKNWVCNYVVPSGHTVTIDFTGVYPTVEDITSSTDVSGYVNPYSTDWTIACSRGSNNWRVSDNSVGGSSGMTSATQFEIVYYTGAWA